MLDTCLHSVSPIQQPDSRVLASVLRGLSGQLTFSAKKYSQRSGTQVLATWG